jgi:putative ABC transport system ATP-binding protein
MMKKVIEIRDLTFCYPAISGDDGFELKVSSWDLLQGEMAVLHGPSGCGKSTLLNLISGSLAMQSGVLEVLDVSRLNTSESERRAHRIGNIGFVFQDFPLVSYLSALENVLFPYRINPVLSLTKEVRLRAESLLDGVGLMNKIHHLPKQLSQGEQQRVAIARAMVTEPQLLLADEPTAGLDPKRAISVMELLEGMVKDWNRTLLVVTHDPMIKARFEKQLYIGESTC